MPSSGGAVRTPCGSFGFAWPVDGLHAPRWRRGGRRGDPLLDLRVCVGGVDDVDDSHTPAPSTRLLRLDVLIGRAGENLNRRGQAEAETTASTNAWMFSNGTSGSIMWVGARNSPPSRPTVSMRVRTSRRTSSGDAEREGGLSADGAPERQPVAELLL